MRHIIDSHRKSIVGGRVFKIQTNCKKVRRRVYPENNLRLYEPKQRSMRALNGFQDDGLGDRVRPNNVIEFHAAHRRTFGLQRTAGATGCDVEVGYWHEPVSDPHY